MRILVLGGNGLIGLAIVQRLHAAGHDVIGLARSANDGARLFPQCEWRPADIAALRSAQNWSPFLMNVDIVVNASGALQDGSRDNLEHIHRTAIAALVTACESLDGIRLIQISAPGAAANATTEFMRSKSRGDEVIKRSSLNWIVLRPGLVIGPNAYGGSALLRMMAAFPWAYVPTFAGKRIQTVAMSDVTQVVLEAVDGRLPVRIDVDVVAPEPQTLQQIIDRLRAWMGVSPALMSVAVPLWAVGIVAWFADRLGHLGWRSPLRSTALIALENEVLGDPAKLRRLRGMDLMSLEQTLAAMPATIQERWFASLALLMPVMVATLSLFWLLSGLIGALTIDRAAAVVSSAVGSIGIAKILVLGGIGVDIVLGATILNRPTARWACIGMIATSIAYLVAGTVLTPALWLDPLGPFLKVLPATLLAAVTWVVLEER
ncbi:MAG: SDR family oxidoreductase [Betaproteobacteria bacterium]